MSNIDPSISNSDVIPVYESLLFRDHPESRFAVGVIAVRDIALPGFDAEYTAHYNLRRQVYVDQTGQLSPEDVHEDGTDRDRDDSRSVAFGVIENNGEEHRLVGTSRLIIKGLNPDPDHEDRRRLPIEREWPQADEFKVPAPQYAFEVSRMISRHERAGIQRINKIQLIKSMLQLIRAYELGPAYAIVEPSFERDLRSLMEVTRIAEPKLVDHYLDVNVPIRINLQGLFESMNIREWDKDSGPIKIMDFYGQYEAANKRVA